jgi:hypothetical protein
VESRRKDKHRKVEKQGFSEGDGKGKRAKKDIEIDDCYFYL